MLIEAQHVNKLQNENVPKMVHFAVRESCVISSGRVLEFTSTV